MPPVTPTIWIHKGDEIDLRHPTPAPFRNLEAVSRSLTRQSRFLGHTRRRYSVAEHSFLAMLLAPAWCRAQALIHDVHEAVVGDVPAPWKVLVPDFNRHERRWQKAAFMAFQLRWDSDVRTAVKVIDRSLLVTELHQLVLDGSEESRQLVVAECGYQPLPICIAKSEFMVDAFHFALTRVGECSLKEFAARPELWGARRRDAFFHDLPSCRLLIQARINRALNCGGPT